MNTITETVSLSTPTGSMDTMVIRPKGEGAYPGIVLYSEIFQLTGPIVRSANIIAGHGFVVALPEIYHDNLEAGTILGYDDEGKSIGNQLKTATPLSSYDEGLTAILDFFEAQVYCSKRYGSIGFCLGGHLAFRAGLNASIETSACFYATDIHSGSLGKNKECDTFERIGEIEGEVMMLWGRQDPHVPQEGREKIYKELSRQEVNFSWHEFNAVHAFMRDEGERFNPSLAHDCYALVVGMFNRILKS